MDHLPKTHPYFLSELIPPAPLTIREWTAFWERNGGAINTFLKLFSLPEIRARVIRIKEILEGEG
jgi:hypothetical protein